jgi:hypothetical protein
MDWEEKYKFKEDQSDLRNKLWGIDWPGHPNEDPRLLDVVEVRNADESLTVEPERWKLLLVAYDPEADYSYDDLALMVRDDGLHVLVNTSGCSCPIPLETWGVVAEGTFVDMIACCEKEKKSWGGEGKLRGPWQEMYDFLVKDKT